MTNQEKITHIKKDNCDRIVEFKTNCGKIYDYETAKEFIKDKKIANAKIKKVHGLEKICETDGGHFEKFPPFA